uniref:Uncharacterized protein n=1 Tax=Globisporangium ultimum (strain ATCC 200006 / CBS 805.95 / DAOM BR144) TaxID=431595 RepID=K3WM72_GLOUD
MPWNHSSLKFNNQYKVEDVGELNEAMQRDVLFREFCRSKVLKRSTLQRWVRIYPKLKAALCPDNEWRQKGSRARRLTVGGSGRVSKSRPIEDELLRHIKDLHRSEIVVTRQHIIDYARSLMPNLFTYATDEACKACFSVQEKA